MKWKTNLDGEHLALLSVPRIHHVAVVALDVDLEKKVRKKWNTNLPTLVLVEAGLCENRLSVAERICNRLERRSELQRRRIILLLESENGFIKTQNANPTKKAYTISLRSSQWPAQQH